MTVLVLTAPDDDTATRVCQALEDRVCDHMRMDLGDFPEKLSFTATGPDWTGWLSDGHRDPRLSEIGSVYYRRPTSFRFPAHLSALQRRFAAAETRQGLGGLLCCLRVPFVNHPSRVADAEVKPAQLQTAEDVGFRVPRTLITSDAEQARAFVREFDGKIILYKPLTAAFLCIDDDVKLVYATPIRLDDLDDDAIALSPCQFQVFVRKRHDVRLVAVGGECFATIIHAGSDKSYWDWRADYPALRYEPVATPEGIASSVLAYLTRFGLVFGCFDFTVDIGGDWWFLECGANAQWGWIEHETAQPIAEAIARQLTANTT